MAIDQASSLPGVTPLIGRDISAEQAASFLASRFGSNVGSVVRAGQGEWSTAYAFRHDDAEYVIRFGAYLEDFAKDRLAARYGSHNLPIPAITEIGDAFGGFYAIAERAYGGFLDALDAEQMRTALPSLFAALDAARQVDLSTTIGYGGWGGDGIAPYATWREALLDVASDRPTYRTHGWRERLRTSPTGDGPFIEALGCLQTLIDVCPEERQLIHADLLNRNVLVVDGRLTAILDWGCAKYGDFLYDLAWILFWQPWYPAWRDVDIRGASEHHYQQIGLEVPHLEERLRCYQVHIGLDGQAYNAFKGQERWADLEAIAQRTLAVATSRR